MGFRERSFKQAKHHIVYFSQVGGGGFPICPLYGSGPHKCTPRDPWNIASHRSPCSLRWGVSYHSATHSLTKLYLHFLLVASGKNILVLGFFFPLKTLIQLVAYFSWLRNKTQLFHWLALIASLDAFQLVTMKYSQEIESNSSWDSWLSESNFIGFTSPSPLLSIYIGAAFPYFITSSEILCSLSREKKQWGPLSSACCESTILHWREKSSLVLKSYMKLFTLSFEF